MQTASTHAPCDIYNVTFLLISKTQTAREDIVLDSLINSSIETHSSITFDFY